MLAARRTTDKETCAAPKPQQQNETKTNLAGSIETNEQTNKQTNTQMQKQEAPTS